MMRPTNNPRNVIYYVSHLSLLCAFSDNIWNTDLDFLVLGGHQSNPPNITLKNMHIEPKTQSVLVPQSPSPSTNRSCKYNLIHRLIRFVFKTISYFFLYIIILKTALIYNGKVLYITYDIWFKNSDAIWNLNSKVKNLFIYLFLFNIKY